MHPPSMRAAHAHAAHAAHAAGRLTRSCRTCSACPGRRCSGRQSCRPRSSRCPRLRHRGRGRGRALEARGGGVRRAARRPTPQALPARPGLAPRFYSRFLLVGRVRGVPKREEAARRRQADAAHVDVGRPPLPNPPQAPTDHPRCGNVLCLCADERQCEVEADGGPHCVSHWFPTVGAGSDAISTCWSVAIGCSGL